MGKGIKDIIVTPCIIWSFKREFTFTLVLCVYVDSLLLKLECCNKGCKIFRQFLGAFMCAGYLLLMSSSIVNLQCMINICTEHGLLMDITFGHVQSNYIAIYPHSVNLPVSLLNVNSVNLQWVT